MDIKDVSVLLIKCRISLRDKDMYIWWTAYKGKEIIIKWGIDKYIEINRCFSDVPIKNDIG